MESKVVVQQSFPSLFFLFLTFMVLKLTKVIDWSWWWVTAPFWIPASICVLGLLFALVLFVIAACMKGK